MENTPRLNLVIDVLMLAGAILAQSGAEIHRVEDTMIRIAHSQGIDPWPSEPRTTPTR